MARGKGPIWPQETLLGSPEALGHPQGARFGPNCCQLVQLGWTHGYHTLWPDVGPFFSGQGPQKAPFDPIPLVLWPHVGSQHFFPEYRQVGCPERRNGMPWSYSIVSAHIEPSSRRKEPKTYIWGHFFKHPVALPVIVAFPVIVALPVIAAFLYHIWVTFFTYMCLGPSCTVLYSAPANYRVVHLVIFYFKKLQIWGNAHAFWIRAVESGSREVGKSLKIGKNRIKSEKSDLISY